MLDRLFSFFSHIALLLLFSALVLLLYICLRVSLLFIVFFPTFFLQIVVAYVHLSLLVLCHDFSCIATTLACNYFFLALCFFCFYNMLLKLFEAFFEFFVCLLCPSFLVFCFLICRSIGVCWFSFCFVPFVGSIQSFFSTFLLCISCAYLVEIIFNYYYLFFFVASTQSCISASLTSFTLNLLLRHGFSCL
jgi:hypothetical protein